MNWHSWSRRSATVFPSRSSVDQPRAVEPGRASKARTLSPAGRDFGLERGDLLRPGLKQLGERMIAAAALGVAGQLPAALNQVGGAVDEFERPRQKREGPARLTSLIRNETKTSLKPTVSFRPTTVIPRVN